MMKLSSPVLATANREITGNTSSTAAPPAVRTTSLSGADDAPSTCGSTTEVAIMAMMR